MDGSRQIIANINNREAENNVFNRFSFFRERIHTRKKKKQVTSTAKYFLVGVDEITCSNKISSNTDVLFAIVIS